MQYSCLEEAYGLSNEDRASASNSSVFDSIDRAIAMTTDHSKFVNRWQYIQDELRKTWESYKEKPYPSFEKLIADLYSYMRIDSQSVSGLCATPMVDAKIPLDALHIVLGVIIEPDDSVDSIDGVDLKIGGDIIVKNLTLRTGIINPLVVSGNAKAFYPILIPNYHETELEFRNKSIRNSVKLWAVGVRVGKHLIRSLDNLIIPDICLFNNGMCYRADKVDACVNVSCQNIQEIGSLELMD